jgi:fumarate reductase subunit C
VEKMKKGCMRDRKDGEMKGRKRRRHWVRDQKGVWKTKILPQVLCTLSVHWHCYHQFLPNALSIMPALQLLTLEEMLNLSSPWFLICNQIIMILINEVVVTNNIMHMKYLVRWIVSYICIIIITDE